MFIVNKNTLSQKNKTNKLISLKTRPDKEAFLDTVVLGVILHKKESLKRHKYRIKNHLYKFYNKKLTHD